MKLLDITQTYEAGMRHYPSIPDFQLEWVRHYDKGSGMALSRFTVTSHLGTHIDAPYHFLSNGARTIDLSLDALCGRPGSGCPWSTPYYPGCTGGL